MFFSFSEEKKGKDFVRIVRDGFSVVGWCSSLSYPVCKNKGGGKQFFDWTFFINASLSNFKYFYLLQVLVVVIVLMVAAQKFSLCVTLHTAGVEEGLQTCLKKDAKYLNPFCKHSSNGHVPICSNSTYITCCPDCRSVAASFFLLFHDKW